MSAEPYANVFGESGLEFDRPGERNRTGEVGEMRERDRDLYSEFLGSRRGGAVQPQRASLSALEHLDVQRIEAVNAEGLDHRLLGSEARGKMLLRVPLTLAVGALSRVEEFVSERWIMSQTLVQSAWLAEVNSDHR